MVPSPQSPTSPLEPFSLLVEQGRRNPVCVLPGVLSLAQQDLTVSVLKGRSDRHTLELSFPIQNHIFGTTDDHIVDLVVSVVNIVIASSGPKSLAAHLINKGWITRLRVLDKETPRPFRISRLSLDLTDRGKGVFNDFRLCGASNIALISSRKL